MSNGNSILPTYDVPNFDAMTSTELSDWWAAYRRAPVKHARSIFPDRPKGYVRATGTLAAYAVAKRCAMDLRRGGQIARATGYENHCDYYYSTLPEWARW